MITVKTESREFDKVERYLLTASKSMVTLKDVPDGELIEVDGYLTFIDAKDDSEVELLSIITPQKKVYVTNSATFRNSFMDIAGIFDNGKFPVQKTSGITKAGRTYIDCVLAVDYLEN